MRKERTGYQSGGHWFEMARIFSNQPERDARNEADCFADSQRVAGRLARTRKISYGWAVYVAAGDATESQIREPRAPKSEPKVERPYGLTERSWQLFLEYANDAGNWSGTPLVGGNVSGSSEDRGNLTQLKRAGLVTTFRSDGDQWLSFTPAGAALAAEQGISLR